MKETTFQVQYMRKGKWKFFTERGVTPQDAYPTRWVSKKSAKSFADYWFGNIPHRVVEMTVSFRRRVVT